MITWRYKLNYHVVALDGVFVIFNLLLRSRCPTIVAWALNHIPWADQSIFNTFVSFHHSSCSSSVPLELHRCWPPPAPWYIDILCSSVMGICLFGKSQLTRAWGWFEHQKDLVPFIAGVIRDFHHYLLTIKIFHLPLASGKINDLNFFIHSLQLWEVDTISQVLRTITYFDK